MFADGLLSKAVAILEELERDGLELAELESHRVFRTAPGVCVFEEADVEAWLAATFDEGEGTRFVTEEEALQLLAAESAEGGTRYATPEELALVAALNG